MIESITSTMSGVVRPGTSMYPAREYGFEIENSEEELPIIGVIDTGISMSTPLAKIVLQDDTFTLDGNPLIDNCGK